MAEETITRLIDDIDGDEATHKVLLGLNGEWRALDLNDGNHDELMKSVERFWQAAQPVRATPAQRRPSKARGTADRGYDLAMLREWAADKKVEVPARGRISGQTVEQFQADLAKGWQPRSR